MIFFRKLVPAVRDHALVAARVLRRRLLLGGLDQNSGAEGLAASEKAQVDLASYGREADQIAKLR